MSAYIIEGGHPLDGSVRIHGAKNSVLPILAACLLAPGECVIHNCPELSDVAASLDILRHLGCRAERQGDAVVVDASAPTGWDVPDALMREMRSSVIFLGAILGRMGRAELCAPGGCELGPRPIDLHLGAIRGLGGRITEDGGGLRAEGALRGADLVLSLPSVGATENAMLAAVCAAGTTTITNAAREPEIVDLQGFLRAIGAKVHGAGSSVITVEGGGASLTEGKAQVRGLEAVNPSVGSVLTVPPEQQDKLDQLKGFLAAIQARQMTGSLTSFLDLTSNNEIRFGYGANLTVLFPMNGDFTQKTYYLQQTLWTMDEKGIPRTGTLDLTYDNQEGHLLPKRWLPEASAAPELSPPPAAEAGTQGENDANEKTDAE